MGGHRRQRAMPTAVNTLELAARRYLGGDIIKAGGIRGGTRDGVFLEDLKPYLGTRCSLPQRTQDAGAGVLRKGSKCFDRYRSGGHIKAPLREIMLLA